MNHDALLEACRGAPDDDAPRLVWADAVGGERGELVVLQCDLARGGLSPAEAGARRRRERELIGKHGPVWSGLTGLARDWEFRRGFVEAAMIDTPVVVERANEIFNGAPLLRSLTATALTAQMTGAADQVRREWEVVERVAQLLASEHVARLDAIDFVAAGDQVTRDSRTFLFEGHGDAIARQLASSGTLGRLRGLGIDFSQLSSRGGHALVASSRLGGLERLWLREHWLGPDALRAVLEQCPGLVALDIVGNVDVENVCAVLPAVRELRIGKIGDPAVDALAASRAEDSLEELAIESGGLTQGGRSFRRFPKLRTLDLKNVQFYGRGFTDFAGLALPALRRLRLGTQLPSASILSIAEAFGRQLEVLDVRGASLDHDDVTALRELVAGDLVIADEYVPTKLL